MKDFQKIGRGLRNPGQPCVIDFVDTERYRKIATLGLMYGTKPKAHHFCTYKPVWGDRLFWFAMGCLVSTCITLTLSTLVK